MALAQIQVEASQMTWAARGWVLKNGQPQEKALKCVPLPDLKDVEAYGSRELRGLGVWHHTEDRMRPALPVSRRQLLQRSALAGQPPQARNSTPRQAAAARRAAQECGEASAARLVR